MRNAEAEAIALAGGEPARELVIALLDQVAQVAQLLERVEELERRFRQGQAPTRIARTAATRGSPLRAVR